jgi:hypothetical protein
MAKFRRPALRYRANQKPQVKKEKKDANDKGKSKSKS